MKIQEKHEKGLKNSRRASKENRKPKTDKDRTKESIVFSISDLKARVSLE